MAEPDKIALETPDLASQYRVAVEELFPGVIADGVIDAGMLGELLGLEVAQVPEGRERYGLQWAGKRDAVRSLLMPSKGTLRPDLELSVDFFNAKNVFIEGDNLEVLKLLQKAYNDQVKLIYIDPPYNTGNDFVYNDDFSDGMRGYLEYTGQLDEDGNRNSTTAEMAGRRHSRWLSMMYPRLVAARNLLTEDGSIFVSIDDNELTTLTLLMDEVFGPENRIGVVTVVSNLKGRSDDKYFATAHNYLLAYQRSSAFRPLGIKLPDIYRKGYPELDKHGKSFRLLGIRKRGSSSRREDRPSMFFPIYVNPQTAKASLAPTEEFCEEVWPKLSDGADGRWRWGKQTVQNRIAEVRAKQVGPARRWDIFQMDYLERDGAERRAIPKTVWDGSEVANEAGSLELKKLMGKRVFETPKPSGLIQRILEYATEADDLVLDFFAGSGTIAHAVANQRLVDGMPRRFVAVNIPEETSQGSAGREAGYETVSEITLARILAVMGEDLASGADGLRVFDLAASNFKDASASEGELNLAATTLAEGVDDLYAVAAEVLLKEGVPLDAPWVEHDFGSVSAQVSGGVAVIIGEGLDVATAEKAYGLDPKPQVVVFLEDDLAGQDALKANLVANAKSHGITVKTV